MTPNPEPNSELKPANDGEDWNRWAKEVCTDFRIPFDDHTVGKRIALTQWMADRDAELTQLREELNRKDQALRNIDHICQHHPHLYCGGCAAERALSQPKGKHNE